MKQLIILLALCACAKTASETAADASLAQTTIIEQQIKKECPAAKIEEPMNALRASIKTQLAACEAEKQILREQYNTLLVILIGLLIIIGISNLDKIKRIL